MSVQVKAILMKGEMEEGPKEIRRFRMEEEGGGMGDRQRMQSLLTRIHSVFNVDTTTQQCALYWRDEDDDLVQFSSGEELRHAVDSMVDDTLRIYVVITERASGGPSVPHPEATANSGANPQPGTSFQAPPPPPPYNHPHPHGPPPPFPGAWAHGGWKKGKPMGPGGWKGGWKGDLFFGCPWGMGPDVYGCGRKGRGFFKHGWDKKTKKMMKTMRCKMVAEEKEFNKIREKVPAEFRNWVRQYVHTWHTQGPEAAQAAAADKLPKGFGQDLPQWLHSFLTRQQPHPRHCGEGEMGSEGEMGNAPKFLPPEYFRWLCLFMPRFFRRNGHFNHGPPCDSDEDEGLQYPGGYWRMYGHGFCSRRGFGPLGKHGCCKSKKGGKHGRWSLSSESDDSDGGQKASHKVPKGFRKFVRLSFKQLRKGKGENPKIKEKATRAGLSAEIQEFVEQIMLEWHAKLSRQHHRVIAKEMMEGERTLPSGLHREHFLWMIRYMARWQNWFSGKCNVMPGWLSDENETDDASGEDATPEEQGCGPCPPFPPAMGAMHGHPFMGMMGAPPHPLGMHPGMNHPFPQPPPMYGCFPPPPPPPGYCPDNPPAYMFECPDHEINCGGRSATMTDKPHNNKDSDAEMGPSTDDMVHHVTEGVKKM